MDVLRHLPALAGAVLLAVASPAGAQSSSNVEIGDVRRVMIWAYGTPPTAARRDLYERTKVVANEAVETVDNGALHLRFLDGSEFRLGPSSRAVLDSFVYEPRSSAGEMVISMLRGTFRYISGRMNKDGIRLITPTAAIGLRGTDIFVHVAEDGTTSIGVREGVAVVNGAVVNVRQQAVVVRGAAPVVGSQPRLGNTVDGRGLSDEFDQPFQPNLGGGGAGPAGGGSGSR